ncbi:MAG: ABC-2 transporter permease [Lachnospiraceae bacterium]|nr:ABC-2 transporter permease [Lachnospiraceae bacterium]MEE1341688.1 ABC-2 transporter permease [Lachnospiraceae bacterium]
MGGLFYKDFIATKAYYYVIAMLGLFFFILLGHGLLPVDQETLDILFMTLILIIICTLFMVIIGNVEVNLMKADEGNKRRAYMLSLPVSKKQYVASKYLFLLLSFYTVLSASLLYIQIFIANCKTDLASGLIEGVAALLPVIAFTFLVVTAIELPFYFAFGTDKGGRVKTGLLVGVFFVGIVYILFGDLSIFDSWSLEAVVEFVKKHPKEVMILQLISPYLSMLVYYISYIVSCKLIGREEEA